MIWHNIVEISVSVQNFSSLILVQRNQKLVELAKHMHTYIRITKFTTMWMRLYIMYVGSCMYTWFMFIHIAFQGSIQRVMVAKRPALPESY